MKKFLFIASIFVVMFGLNSNSADALSYQPYQPYQSYQSYQPYFTYYDGADDYYYFNSNPYNDNYYYNPNYNYPDYWGNYNNSYYCTGYPGYYICTSTGGGGSYGGGDGIYFDNNGNGNSHGGTRPQATTHEADDVDQDSAYLRGKVDMNSYDDGIVFFAYGQDEDKVDDVEDDYDNYDDARDDEDGDDFQVERVDSNLDGHETYREKIDDLDEDERYYFTICVEYGHDRLECGTTKDFDTDGDGNNNDDQKPDATTYSAQNIESHEAELSGNIDMNDFDNGRVFFVYGESESMVQDVDNEHRYSDVDEDGDNLQKELADSDLDNSATYYMTAENLDANTDIYYSICVEYEDNNNDKDLVCGNVRHFETD